MTVEDPVRHGKAFALAADGTLQKKITGWHRRGRLRRVRTDLRGLLAMINQAGPGQHLVCGVPPDLAIEAEACLAAADMVQPGDLTRTEADLPFPDGPGLMVIDNDLHGDVDLLQEQLHDACPSLAEVRTLVTTSSSANIWSTDGTELRGATGLHQFVPVADARDTPRALQVLNDRLWLAGHGAIRESDAGLPLLRSPVDLHMDVSVQPVFLHAHCGPGLEQRKGFWWAPNAEAELELLDTRTALPDLTDDERARLQLLQRQAIEDAGPALADARAAWEKRQVQQLVARGIDPDQAREHCRQAADAADLCADWLLTLADGRTVTVGEVLAEPARFHGMPCRDPLEPDYGSSSVAMLFTDQTKPMLNSNAHGGRKYFLKPFTAAQLDAASRTRRLFTAARTADAANGTTTHLASPDQPEPHPLDLVELSTRQWPPTTWAVADMLPHGHVTLLSANGGVGKSTVALQMAVAVATGTEFLGLKSTQGRVLVFSAEDGDAILHTRLAHIAADAGTSLADLSAQMTVWDATRCEPTMWRETGPTDRLAWLAERAAQERPTLLIIDNASDVYAGNENDRAAVRAFVRALAAIAADVDCAVLLLAHVDKASVRGLVSADTMSTFSGSTAWHNSARSRLAMTREGELVSLRHEKANLGPQLSDLELEFDATAKLFRLAGTIPGQAAARALMRSQHRIAVLRLIKEATSAGQNLSMRAKAHTNAFLQLRTEPGFPHALDRGEFFTLLKELARDGLISEATVVTPSRNRVQVIKLTEVGELRVASGSAAPSMWHARAAA